jgi:pyrroline-5-carboxylate reductase
MKKTMEKKKIAIIGAGNMGNAIVKGLLKSQFVRPSDIYVSDPKEKALQEIASRGVNVSVGNVEVVQKAEVVILAVKPYHYKAVLQEIKDDLTPDTIVISIVAGVGLADLEAIAGDRIPIFRAMPNTAISLQESLTCISTNGNTEPHRAFVMNMFDHLGKTVLIHEELMAAATVLSSCGIAFALRYIRAAMQGGIEIGFGAETAQLITAQTVKGATELIMQTGHHPEREIDKVTTPRGVTITGLNEMEHKGFSSSLIRGLMASYNKINKLQ